ncbi:hypothetical protein EGT36_27115 [Agrobacterium sp. FDAARGOS_525]|uniref:hypothetical protein n=1 Tax=Agrobacterium sp. FDAARGOS_525 TaxID=2420311 RepID=UPI000F67DB52|nr:hypothetical protein [Agrobacterium sp. FDAARGOS_525]RSC29947.1 hypothetical protein EGT36_27115 [Agrobacterium sp. FDAARGOS_525]
MNATITDSGYSEDQKVGVLSQQLYFSMDTGFGWTWSDNFSRDQAQQIINAPVGATLTFDENRSVLIGEKDITFSKESSTGTSHEDLPRKKVVKELTRLLR